MEVQGVQKTSTGREKRKGQTTICFNHTHLKKKKQYLMLDFLYSYKRKKNIHNSSMF